MMEIHPVRLLPGQDLKRELDYLVRDRGWSAACVLSGIGSLSCVVIRYAGAERGETLEGPFEIVSLSGTLSGSGSHLHLLVSDERGEAKAGHLMEGATIHTTAEIVLGILPGWAFDRQLDQETGYAELTIERRRD